MRQVAGSVTLPRGTPLEGAPRLARLPNVTRAAKASDAHLPPAEIPLIGGRTTPCVVRVGDTVRRPQGAQSPFVHRLLVYLEAVGYVGAPRFLGIDEQQREVLSFIPGEVPSDLGVFSDVQLDAAARMLRALHDATQGSALCGGDEVICHGDASPCNAVFWDGLPYAWIDFDAASPGNRGEDLGYAAWLWLDIGNEAWTPETQSGRLARFFAVYGEPGTDPVESLLDAQMRLCRRDGVHQSWAERSRSWTECHRIALGGAI